MSTSPSRIDALLAQLTLEEKVALLAGATTWETAPIPRLGIPALKTSDGPAGARGASGFAGGTMTAASFPAPVAMAATWNTELLEEIGVALGQEAKSKGVRVLLGPTVNNHRTPLNGRAFECYSEDPYLSAVLAVAYVRGLQSEGVGATVKHYAGNDSEFQRNSIDSRIDERTLREITLPPFEAVVCDADPWCVMASYNRVNGVFAGEHAWLLQEVLKGDWGFEGVVMSDWFGTQSTVDAANNGLDLEMPGPTMWRGQKLVDAVRAGEVSTDAIDDSVRRVLRLIERAGLFDEPARAEEIAEDRPEHRALIRRIGAESAVLLKNRDNLLPLDLASIGSIAVIGPGAANPPISGGGSARFNPHHIVSPLTAIQAPAGDQVRVGYEPGASNHRYLPLLERDTMAEEGFAIEYFASLDCAGDPVSHEPTLGSEHVWLGNVPPGVPARAFSARFSTVFRPKSGGTHQFSLVTGGKARLALDGELVVDNWTAPEPGPFYFGMGTTEVAGAAELEEGRAYRMTVEYSTEGGRLFAMRLGHLPPVQGDPVERAASLAARCDLAVVFVGTNGDWETEGEDRAGLDLPGEQNRLIEHVVAANHRTIVVLQTGSPVTMPWLEQVPAVVQAWFGGQEAGDAIWDVLTGAADPGGRLPLTFPARIEDTPAFLYEAGENGRVHYGERIFVGYRWYEKRKIAPLFPFGHGLSYTDLVIANLEIGVATAAEPEGEFRVPDSLTVTNAGERPGQAVVQLYVRDVRASVPRPEKELKGVRKVTLPPKETAHLAFTLDRRAFAYWDDERHAWVAEASDYEVLAGSSSAEIHAHATLTLPETLVWR